MLDVLHLCSLKSVTYGFVNLLPSAPYNGTQEQEWGMVALQEAKTKISIAKIEGSSHTSTYSSERDQSQIK